MLKPRWSSATFLQYLGVLVALVSLGVLLDLFEEAHGTGGLVAWSALALVLSAGLALAARARGEAILAGLLAVVAVAMWATMIGTLMNLIGLLDEPDGERFFHAGLALDWIVLEVLIVAACAVVLATFHFPLVVLVLAETVWYAVLDLLEGVVGGGDTMTAFLSLAVGFVFVLVAGRSTAAGPTRTPSGGMSPAASQSAARCSRGGTRRRGSGCSSFSCRSRTSLPHARLRARVMPFSARSASLRLRRTSSRSGPR